VIPTQKMREAGWKAFSATDGYPENVRVSRAIEEAVRDISEKEAMSWPGAAVLLGMLAVVAFVSFLLLR
jgi:hypothetical protein